MRPPHHTAPRPPRFAACWLPALLAVLLLNTPTRLLAANFYVTNGGDSGPGSLRQAIAGANASPDASDTVIFGMFGTGAGQIALTSGELTVGAPGKSIDILAPTTEFVVSAGGASRVFHVTAGSVSIGPNGMTISGGNAPGGTGGAVLVDTGATLTLSRCLVTGSTADIGGAIASTGTLTLTNCTVSNSTAGLGAGGLYNEGTLALTNCTIAGNSAPQDGGIDNVGTLTVTSSTITGNTASASGSGFAGGLGNRGTATLNATLVALNTASGVTSPDVSGAFVSHDSNLIGKRDGSTGFTSAHDQTGTIAAPLDPGLDPNGLQTNNGGALVTVALFAGSPAIDADYSASPPPYDERNLTRSSGARADIGAFEAGPDATPPVTTVALTGPSFANGFWRGPVTVTLKASDSGIGVAHTFYRVDDGTEQTYSMPFTVSGDGQHVVAFYSVDQAGNAENRNQSITISIDTTPPVTTITSRAVASGGEVTLTAADNLSGPAGTFYRVDSGPQQTYTGPFIVTGNFQHLVTAYSMDRALNTENPAKSLTFTVDTAGPTTTPAISGPSFVNGFWRGPVTITLTATDKGSAIANTFYRVDSGPQQTYTGPFTVTGDFQHLVTFYSTDTVGLTESPARSAGFKIDSTAPVTTITSRVVPGGQEVTLKNTDNFSGPGGTFYRVDSGPQQSYTAPFVVTGTGQHLVTAYSIDRAANAEPAARSLSFTNAPPPPPPDTTPPVTTPALAGPSYFNGFWRGSVTVTLNASDNASGVAATFYRVDSGPQQTYAGPFPVGGDGAHLVTFYSVDNAGNAEGPAKSVTFSIDTTPPATTASLSGARFRGGFRGPVSVTLSATDGVSGPGGTFYSVDSGPQQTYTGPFTVSAAGRHRVTFFSLDRAGNAEGAQATEFGISR